VPRSCRTCKLPQRPSMSVCALCKTRSSNVSSSVALVVAAGAAMWCMTLRSLEADSLWSGLSAAAPHRALQPAQSWRCCQKFRFPPPKSAFCRLLSSVRLLPAELQTRAVESLRPPTLRCSVAVKATLHQAALRTRTRRGTVGLGIQLRPRCKLSTVRAVPAYPRQIHHYSSLAPAKTALPCCQCRSPPQSLEHGRNRSRRNLAPTMEKLRGLRMSMSPH